MRRLVFAAFAAVALLWGFPGGVALAQGCGPQNPNCVVPTAPAGTSNNQAASTAFVQGAVAVVSPGGSSGQVQTNNGIGGFGGLSNSQLTALVNTATASLSGALPAWPNNATTYFRGDGTYQALNCAALGNAGTACTQNTGASGHAIPFLDGANTWSGVQKTSADAYFGSGRPWADVRSGANSCAAALGNNSNDDTAAIQCQLTFAGASGNSASVVFAPCGNYKVTSQLTIPANVFLVGQGLGCTEINASAGNFQVIDITGNYAGIVGVFVLGNDTAGAAQALVVIASGTVGVQIRDSYLWGGINALQVAGIDCYLQNNFIGSAPGAASISLYLHGGVCKVIGNKIDPPSGTGFIGVQIDNIVSGGTAVIENILIANDISGYTTSLAIDDSADASGRTAITTLIGNTIGGPVNVHSALVTSISSGELAGNVTVNGTTAGPVSLTGVSSVSGNHTAAGAICAGNSNISCSTVVASLPSCSAATQGTRMFVTDQATAVAYHGAVTGSGVNKQAVVCDGSAYYQD